MTSPEPTDLSSYRERRVLEESGAEALPRRGSSFENSVMRAFIEYTAERTSEKLRSDMAQVVAEQLEKVGEARSHALHFSPFLTFDQADPRRFEYPPREGDVVVFDDTEEKVYVHQGPETRAVIRPEPGRTPPPRVRLVSTDPWRVADHPKNGVAPVRSHGRLDVRGFGGNRCRPRRVLRRLLPVFARGLPSLSTQRCDGHIASEDRARRHYWVPRLGDCRCRCCLLTCSRRWSLSRL